MGIGSGDSAITLKRKSMNTLTVLLSCAVTAALFQSCQNPVSYNNITDLSKAGYRNVYTSEYDFKVTKEGENSPPLKMFFIVDNSYTMKANQVNLAHSFRNIFGGENGRLLTKFDSTIYILSTAQTNHPDDLKAIRAAVPDFSIESISQWSPVELASHRQADAVSGKIPGDILGYFFNLDLTGKRFYYPAPVASIKADNSSVAGLAINVGIQKPKGHEPSQLAEEFEERIRILSPDRNNVRSPASMEGVFDKIIDRESGLCAMARVLRHSDRFISAGDTTAFIIISDEDEQDPTGSKCIDSEIKTDRTAAYADVVCEGKINQAKMTYIQPGLAPRCRFNYTHELEVQVSQMRRRVDVTYNTSERVCTHRDGVETECRNQIQSTTTTFDDSGQSCNYFISQLSDPRVVPGSVVCSAPYSQKWQTTFSISPADMPKLIGKEPPLQAPCSGSIKNHLVRAHSLSPELAATCRYSMVQRSVGAFSLSDFLTGEALQRRCQTEVRSHCLAQTTTLQNYFTCGYEGQIPAIPQSTNSILFSTPHASPTCNSKCAELGDSDFAACRGKSEMTVLQALRESRGPGSVSENGCRVEILRADLNKTYERKGVQRVQVDSRPNGGCKEGDRQVSRQDYEVEDVDLDFVSGTVGRVPQKNLINYIVDRSSELFGNSKPIVHSIVTTEESGPFGLGSVGKKYIELSRRLGGHSYDIKAADYSSMLSHLRDQIQDRTNNSFILKGYGPQSKIDSIHITRASGTSSEALQSDQWKVNGSTLVIDGTNLYPGDVIKVKVSTEVFEILPQRM